jgi:opacity protein-like surface antigen
MKKIFITSVLSFATCTAFAGDWYGSVGLDQKDKQNVTTGEYHNVFSMTIGKKLGDGYSVEALIEDEQVRSASAKHEGLYQLRVNKDFHTETMFTPYVGLAAGMKSKEGGLNASLDFPFYRYDLGIKAKLTEQITARLGWRHRQAMDAVYDTKDYTDKEITDFIESIPAKAFEDIGDFFVTLPVLTHELHYKDSDGTDKTITLQGIDDFFQ